MKDIFWAYMDLEKSYDTIDWHGQYMAELIGYGVGVKLMKLLQYFCVESRGCVLVKNHMNGWFLVNVGLRQGCVMSP